MSKQTSHLTAYLNKDMMDDATLAKAREEHRAMRAEIDQQVLGVRVHLQETRDSAYRIITRLQRDNVELFQTLQSATAWIRAAGGDCITLDEIVSRHKPAYRDNADAIATIEQVRS